MSKRSGRVYNLTVNGFSIILAVLVFYYAFKPFVDRIQFTTLIVPFSLFLIALTSLKGKRIYPIASQKGYLFVAVFFMLLCAFIGFYFFTEFRNLAEFRTGDYNTLDLIVGAIAVFLVIQLTWTAMGWAIPVMTLVLISYAGGESIFLPDVFIIEG